MLMIKQLNAVFDDCFGLVVNTRFPAFSHILGDCAMLEDEIFGNILRGLQQLELNQQLPRLRGIVWLAAGLEMIS